MKAKQVDLEEQIAIEVSEQKDSRGKRRGDFQTVNTLPSETIQSDADNANITKILAKFHDVGVIQLNDADALFLDVTEFTDFADVMRQSKIAEVEFLKLPSKVREIFNHDVADWLDTAHDQEKRDALVEAGYLRAPDKPPEPEPPPVVEPPVVPVVVDPA